MAKVAVVGFDSGFRRWMALVSKVDEGGDGGEGCCVVDSFGSVG